MQWQNEDVIRTKLRLSIVLPAQNRTRKVSKLRKEIFKTLENIKSASEQSTCIAEDDIKLLHFEVSIFHSRISRIWYKRML